MIDIWYRYEDRRYAAPLNDFDESTGDGPLGVRLIEWQVVKYTPKGVWLTPDGNFRKFVLKDARKRFACPTVEEARQSFIARKQRQIRIYAHRVRDAERAIKVAERMDEPGEKYANALDDLHIA